MYIVSSENITTLSGPQGTFFAHKSKARASSFTPQYPPPRLVCFSHRTPSPITSKTRCIKYVQKFYAYLHNVQRISSINFTENRARSSKLFRHLCLSDVLKEGVINNIPTTIKRSQKYNLFRMERKMSMFKRFYFICSELTMFRYCTSNVTHKYAGQRA